MLIRQVFSGCGKEAISLQVSTCCWAKVIALSPWLFVFEHKVARCIRNQRVKELCNESHGLTRFFRVCGWNCRSREGQSHRLLCCLVVKQWRSVANTALFPHGCTACLGGWKDLLHFALCGNGLLEDTQLSHPEWKHAVHSTKGFQSQTRASRGLAHKGIV